MRMLRWVVVPCPLLFLLVGCALRTTEPAASADVVALDDPDADAATFGQDQLYALGRALAYEQQRSAALEQELHARSGELQQLRQEVQTLRQRETALEEKLHALERGGAGRALRYKLDVEQSMAVSQSAGSAAQGAAAVAALTKELSGERQRRQEVESQLERLKEETSSAPYGAVQRVVEADLLAAKQEIVDLRRVLDGERAERDRLAADFRSLQERAALASAQTAGPPPENPEQRAQLDRLLQERQAALDSFDRSLAGAQEETDEIEKELDAEGSTAAAGTAGEIGSVRAENVELRTRLEVEQRRTEELAAKLKVATRITDLLFKMQEQETQAAPR